MAKISLTSTKFINSYPTLKLVECQNSHLIIHADCKNEISSRLAHPRLEALRCSCSMLLYLERERSLKAVCVPSNLLLLLLNQSVRFLSGSWQQLSDTKKEPHIIPNVLSSSSSSRFAASDKSIEMALSSSLRSNQNVLSEPDDIRTTFTLCADPRPDSSMFWALAYFSPYDFLTCWSHMVLYTIWKLPDHLECPSNRHSWQSLRSSASDGIPPLLLGHTHVT